VKFAAMVLLAIVSMQHAHAQAFAGHYRTMHQGAEISLVLNQSGNQVTGTYSDGGPALQVKGAVIGGILKATASIASLPFTYHLTISRQGGKLIMEIYELDDSGKPDPESRDRFEFPAGAGAPSPPAASPGAAPKPKKAPSKPASKPVVKASPPTRAPSGWKTLKHPLGVSIRYPGNWTQRDTPLGIQFLPPGVAVGGDEVYLLGGIPAQGVTDSADPRVEQTAVAVISQSAPALHRAGEAKPMQTQVGAGRILAWEGGSNGRARMYLAIAKDHLIALTAIGSKPKLDKRDPILRQLFATLSAGSVERDQRIAGVWKYTGTSSIDAKNSVGRITASSVSDSQRTIVVRPDGTCTWRQVSRTIALGSGVSIDSGDQVETKNGQWVAGSGRVTLIWDNGKREEYAYRLNGAQLLLIDSGSTQVWQRN